MEPAEFLYPSQEDVTSHVLHRARRARTTCGAVLPS